MEPKILEMGHLWLTQYTEKTFFKSNGFNGLLILYGHQETECVINIKSIERQVR